MAEKVAGIVKQLVANVQSDFGGNRARIGGVQLRVNTRDDEPDRGSPRMLPQVGRQELQVLEVMSVEAVDDVLLGKISIWTCLPWRSTWIREFWTGFTPSDFDAKVRDGTFTVV